jgi:arylsulfatase B
VVKMSFIKRHLFTVNVLMRTGKYSDFEGGVRGAAFASGGFIPVAMRGTVFKDPMHLADYYTTFAALAGAPARQCHS